jgi:hypothetical protein
VRLDLLLVEYLTHRALDQLAKARVPLGWPMNFVQVSRSVRILLSIGKANPSTVKTRSSIVTDSNKLHPVRTKCELGSHVCRWRKSALPPPAYAKRRE